MKFYITCCSLLLLLTLSATAEMRTWTARNGKTFEGKLLSDDGTQVTLKGQNGKSVKVPIEGLSQEDQDYIAFNRPIDLNIELGRSNSAERDNYYCPHVQISRKRSLAIGRQLDLYLVVFDEDGHIIARHRDPDIKIPTSGKSLERYYEEAHCPASRYGDMLLMVVDSSKKIVAFESTGKEFEERELQNRLLFSEMWIHLQQDLKNPVLKGMTFHLYDLARARNGGIKLTNNEHYLSCLSTFVSGGCKSFSSIAPYFRATNELYSVAVTLPPTSASSAMMLHGYTNLYRSRILPYDRPVLHYQNRMKHDEDISFRFIIQSDELMAVCFNNKKVVVNHPDLAGRERYLSTRAPIPYATRNPEAFKSEWISLKKDEPFQLDVLIASTPADDDKDRYHPTLSGFLFVEVNNGSPPGRGMPSLFATEELPNELLDWVYAGRCPPGTAPPEPVIFTLLPPEKKPEGSIDPFAKNR